MRKASITFRCKEELKEDLEEIAKLDTKEGEKVNVSNTINVILTEYVNESKNK